MSYITSTCFRKKKKHSWTNEKFVRVVFHSKLYHCIIHPLHTKILYILSFNLIKRFWFFNRRWGGGPESHLFIRNMSTSKLYVVESFLGYLYIYIHVIYKLIQNEKNLVVRNTKLLFQGLPHWLSCMSSPSHLYQTALSEDHILTDILSSCWLYKIPQADFTLA